MSCRPSPANLFQAVEAVEAVEAREQLVRWPRTFTEPVMQL
jgi:hypothetical protein